MKSIVDDSHDFLKKCLHPQAICIDATLGNGKDTQFFLTNKAAKVYAFEIQQDVYQKTVESIHDPRLTAYCAGHETMDRIQDLADVIIFNFGYCPKGNKKITTLPETSLKGVQIGIGLLKPKGRMALVFYPHEKGKEEAHVITSFLQTQNNIDCIQIQRLFIDAPFMIGIEKKR